MSDTRDLFVEEMVAYTRHLAARVERAFLCLPADKRWARPYDYGNSAGHLVLHLTGNLDHYIGALVADSGYVLDRPREFAEPSPPPDDVALAEFRRAIDATCRTLEAQDDDDLAVSVAGQPPIRTRLGLFLVCVAHLNHHVGQLAYLVKAHGCETGEPPSW